MKDYLPLVAAVEMTLALAGLALFWRFSRQLTKGSITSGLARWEVEPLDFGLMVWGVFATGLVGLLVLSYGAQALEINPDTRLVISSTGLPLGVILAYAGLRRNSRLGEAALALPHAHFIRSGFVTFLLVLPLVSGVAFGWQAVLELAGLPTELQDVVENFLDLKTPGQLAVMSIAAVVLAPVAEELVFRGLLFRYARGRLPRWGALLLPAALWAALHGLTAFAPLLAMGVVLELAYERTGNLAVPMGAHALFNLNTILVLLLDPPK